MHSPARLALSYLKSAVQAGADAANYVEVTNFLRHGNRIIGVEAEDTLTGDKVEIRGKVVLNAAGPWAERLLNRRMGLSLTPELAYSRDAFVVVERSITERYALAVQGRTADPDAIVSRGHRHLFIVPWRRYSLIGVWHVVHRGKPDEFTVTEEDLQGFIDEINEAYPPLELTLGDVSIWNAGLILFGNNEQGSTDLSYGKRSVLVDHARDHGVDSLVTMIGVRYTTSRGVAKKAVNLVFRKLGKRPPKCTTEVTPIYGGQIERFDELVHQAAKQRPSTVDQAVMSALVHNHGSEYKQVLKYIDHDPEYAEALPGSTVTKAEVVHAVREEMAQKLGDIVFRRTDLGTGGNPGEHALRECADLMASEFGWDEGWLQKDLAEVKAAFPHSFAEKPARAVTCTQS
jgi:glycerol-3-phosphate dehydrogenase